MMNRPLLFALSLLAAFTASAQEKPKPKALFNDSTSVTGGYFGFTPKLTNVMGADVLLLGFSGAFILEHKVALGLGGAWSSSTIKNVAYEQFLRDFGTEDVSGLELRYGYGGLLIEPMILGKHCLLYTSPSPRDRTRSRMPSSA